MATGWQPAGYHPRMPGHGEPEDSGRAIRVLRVSHSSVVTDWRERDRALRRRGVDVALVTAARWNEGGSVVPFDPAGDSFAHPVRTLGSHPNLFVFAPVALWRLLGKGPYDLIDAHEEPYSVAVAEVLVLLALRRLRIPLVLYSAQNLPKVYPVPFRWSERWALRRAAGAYVCNTAAGDRLRNRGFGGELALLPLGVDIERYHPEARRPPSGCLRVGYVGRLTRQKGVDVLLAALTRDQRLHAEIVGSGPEAAALVDRAVQLRVRDRVTFTGHVGADRLPDIYRRFDAVVIPSVPEPGLLEQFGRVAVEAQAAGVPVVASAIGALPDVVGDAGILVPAGDPGALAGALGRLLDEPGLWERLRADGLGSAARYSWEAVADRHLALYRAVLSRVPWSRG